ncbi:unnamed protein product [Microthlaspi erraticum]|uniref:Reverse transcriptase zinc-binding domain-containing protein n=1 Tax=Microthlaspi erraticum TaxID=1685480 RepID=A0A6D2HZW7_9BRAS|nr:unnamed protein product [Microthlaspi erraticum]
MEPSLNPLRQQIWELKIDPRIQAFLWKMLCRAIPVAERLVTRGSPGHGADIRKLSVIRDPIRLIWITDFPIRSDPKIFGYPKIRISVKTINMGCVNKVLYKPSMKM